MRRAVVLAISFLLAVPLVTEAQTGKRLRIGVLMPLTPEDNGQYVAALRRGLRELGYVEGQNIAFEVRYADAKPERLSGLAAELVRLPVDVVVAGANPAIAAAQKATTSIPIVMTVAVDPVGTGFVASLPRPGGNITGVSTQQEGPEILGKALQLLKEAAPTLTRVAVLSDRDFPGNRQRVSVVEAVAPGLGVELQLMEVRSAGELEGAFAAATRNRVGAAYILGSPLFFHHRARIGELVVKHRLPTMCGPLPDYAQAGCLMGLGSTLTDQMKRAAYFVDRILKGGKPGDLPVEQPTKFDLVINLKTAKAIGLTIPQSLLGRADQIIE